MLHPPNITENILILSYLPPSVLTYLVPLARIGLLIPQVSFRGDIILLNFNQIKILNSPNIRLCFILFFSFLRGEIFLKKRELGSAVLYMNFFFFFSATPPTPQTNFTFVQIGVGYAVLDLLISSLSPFRLRHMSGFL